MSDDHSLPLSRRRLLFAGGGLIGAAATGGLGFGAGRRTATPPAAPAAPDALQHFASRPDLALPVVSITTPGSPAAGQVFLTPAAGAGLRGPLLVDNTGAPVFFRQVPAPADVAIDAKVQKYAGKPVLTWWEGVIDKVLGVGAGDFVMVDDTYREIARIAAPPGEPADQHDLVLTDRGTALFLTCPAVAADLSAIGGPARGALYDNVITEVDVATGRQVRRWSAREHIGVAESYAPAPKGTTPHDFLHANSLDVDHDGHLLMSARHTWTIYKIHRQTGAIMWRLGGKRSDFTIADGAAFSWQHDARRRSDGTLGLFDNGAGITHTEKQSRGMVLKVDERARTATLVRQFLHPEGVLAASQGSLQELPDGGSLVGWGAEPYFSEYAPDGSLRFAGNLPSDNVSYRAYRFAWRGVPADRPVAVAQPSPTGTTVYVSWNGATEVRSWQVRGGQQPEGLDVLGKADRTGFETAINLPASPNYLAVHALDGAQRVLGASTVIAVTRPAG